MLELSYANEEEWRAIRATHIGSSESPALGGISTWITPFALYHAKLGKLAHEAPENNRMEAGKRLESAIAQWAADLHHYDLTRAQVYVESPTIKGMGSTLDYIITDKRDPERGPGLLETKNRDWLVWKKEWTETRVPADVAWQTQHQFATSGFRWGAVACLVGGNTLQHYPIEAREKVMSDIETRVADFWAAIANGLEPPVEGLELEIDLLKDLYAEVQPELVIESEDVELAETARMFAWAQGNALSSDKTAVACKAKIFQVMKDAAVLQLPAGISVRQSISKNNARRFKVTEKPEGGPMPEARTTLEAG